MAWGLTRGSSMQNAFKSFVFGVALSFATVGGAHAVSLTPMDPTIGTAGDFIDVTPDVDVVDFFAIGVELPSVSGVAPLDPLFLDLLLTVDTAFPEDTFGDFEVLEDGVDLFLSGDLIDFEVSGSLIKAAFSTTGGSAAAAFGPTVLGIFEFGGDPLALSGDVDFAAALSAVESPVSVPLPGGLALLLAGLGGLLLVRRKSA